MSKFAINRTALAAVWPPTAAVAAKAGHQPVGPLVAIRQKCLDCSGGQPMEDKLCPLVTCALWPFRAGRHPYKKRPAIDGVSRERGRGGTWKPASPSSPETPTIAGEFLESAASTIKASTAPWSEPS